MSTAPQQDRSGAPEARAPRNGLGLAALILGVIGVLTCWLVIGGLFGLLAIVLGVLGASRARRGRATNRGVAVAGIVTGALALIVSIVIVAVGGTLFFSTGGGNLVDCVSQANGDQARVQQCGQQYGQQLNQQGGQQ